MPPSADQAADARRALIHAADTARGSGPAAFPGEDIIGDLRLFRHRHLAQTRTAAEENATLTQARQRTGHSPDAVESLVNGVFQDVVEAGGLCREHFGALVLAAVGGGLGDAEALAEAAEVRLVAEPGQDELRLLPAGQGTGPVPGAEFLPALAQEVRNP